MQKLCLLAERSGLWPVANTKTKKEKTKKPLKLAILEKKWVSIPDSLDPTCQKIGSYAKNCDLYVRHKQSNRESKHWGHYHGFCHFFLQPYEVAVQYDNQLLVYPSYFCTMVCVRGGGLPFLADRFHIFILQLEHIDDIYNFIWGHGWRHKHMCTPLFAKSIKKITTP